MFNATIDRRIVNLGECQNIQGLRGPRFDIHLKDKKVTGTDKGMSLSGPDI
jgi:hypothetical protein